jgi:hypothetical protein
LRRIKSGERRKALKERELAWNWLAELEKTIKIIKYGNI